MNNHNMEDLDMRTIDGEAPAFRDCAAPSPEGIALLVKGEPVLPGKGMKHDQGKPQWNLLPWYGMEEVVQVLTFGAKKYEPENWRRVPDARSRYSAAALRHISAFMQGQERDEETDLHHLAHATCCLLFLLEILQFHEAGGE